MFDAQRERQYKVFDPILQKINSKFITPDKALTVIYSEALDEVLKGLKELLYDTEPGLKKYGKILYTGSTFDNVSVGKTYKEFDINFYIKINESFVTVEKTTPGFVNLKVDIPKYYRNQCPDLVNMYDKWIDNSHYLMPDKFIRWCESTLNKCFNGGNHEYIMKGEEQEYHITCSKSGPAITLHVEVLNKTSFRVPYSFDVDIVFAPHFNKICLLEMYPNEEWIAVAKLPKNFPKNARGWRYSYPQVEKRMITGNNHLKTVLRLIKKIRDKENMKYFASYYIKVMFLHQIDVRPDNYWDKSMGYILMDMICILLDHLEERYLENYYCSQSNLFDNLSEQQIQDATNRIESVRENLEKYSNNVSENIKKVILTPEEIILMDFVSVEEINLGINNVEQVTEVVKRNCSIQ